MRTMSKTAVTAPKAASSTPHTIAAMPTDRTIACGTPTLTTIGTATIAAMTIASDKNASSHMTVRMVRS
jgi:hypothetical protein